MEYSDFKKIYESLGLSILSVMRITGKSRSALEKWAQEGLVKEPTTAVLFRLAAMLKHPPYSLSSMEIVSLLYIASGYIFSSPHVYLAGTTEQERFELKALYTDRLKAIAEATEILNAFETDIANGIDHFEIQTSEKTEYVKKLLEFHSKWVERAPQIADFAKATAKLERDEEPVSEEGSPDNPKSPLWR